MAETTRREALGGLSSLESIPPKQRTEQQKESIKALQNIIENQESVINATKANVEMNPDDFDAGEYTDLFTKRFITGFSKKLAYENTKVELKKDEVFIIGLEHRNKISQINAEGAQDRLTAQFEDDVENYSVSSTSTLGGLSGIPNILGKGFKLDTTKTPEEQIDSVIKNIQDNTGLTEVNKNAYITQLASLKKLYGTARSGAGNSKVVFNKYAGLGRVETSPTDLLSSSIFDVMASGKTIEVMKRDTSKSSKANETPAEKIAAERAKLTEGFKSIYQTDERKKNSLEAVKNKTTTSKGYKTDEEIADLVDEALAKKLEGSN
jgi:hypothetical protein